jgi:Undecaprenyl-phosphate galactose phosphotransferase WbaP
MKRNLTAAPLILVPVKYEQLHAANIRRWKLVLRRWLVPAVFVLTDSLLSVSIWKISSVLQGIRGQGALSEITTVAMVTIITAWIGLRALLGLYPGYGLDSAERLRRHTYATLAALAMLAIFALGFQIGHLLSRLMVALMFLGLLVLTPLVQCLVKSSMQKLDLWGKPAVVLGYKEAGAKVASLLKEKWEIGYKPLAIFDYRLELGEAVSEDVGDQQVLTAVVDLAREHDVHTAIFAMPHIRREHLAKIVSLASLYFRHVLIVPNLDGLTNSAVVARDLAGTFAVEIRYNLLNPWALRAKRAADLAATVIGGALIVPLVLLLILLVYLESGRPVFYRDSRLGKDAKLFSCLKFRTMVSDAEALLQRVLEEDTELREEYTRYHKLHDDPRVTRVGRFLRKTSLDELPQLWNVLRGEMSLVGPRPYLPRESKEIGVTQSEILRVPPGITGPWQVSGRNRLSFSDRVQMDACYVRDWSIWLDVVLLARTAKTLLFDRVAY